MAKNSQDWILQQYAKEIADKQKKSEDFYYEDGKKVMTEEYHLKRGFCCGSKCRHCPYSPKYVKGTTEIE
jgi:hypothetical protein